jgi:hypothetical protein
LLFYWPECGHIGIHLKIPRKISIFHQQVICASIHSAIAKENNISDISKQSIIAVVEKQNNMSVI